VEFPQLILKKGKEKAIKNRHHWIFSGAVAREPSTVDNFVTVTSEQGEILGTAYYNPQTKIIGRMVSFGAADPYETMRNQIYSACGLRKSLFDHTKTNAYRLINGEGDFLPGLIVDRYRDVLVIQISTLGMEKLRSFIVEALVENMKPKAIYEKSNLPSRKEEGLKDIQGWVFGSGDSQLEILENGHQFLVSFPEGQKTGFFLDHREMRRDIGSRSRGKRILNCFAYSGGFSVYAAACGAAQVDSVDISEKAIELARANMKLNGFDKGGFYAADVFQFLRENPLNYDVVILDPPAFAKRQKDIIQGCRGYKDINRVALQKMPPRSLLLTCSCSYFVDEPLFQKVVFQASVEANRRVRIIGRHRMGADHPINICHPESDYLKSLLLFVE